MGKVSYFGLLIGLNFDPRLINLSSGYLGCVISGVPPGCELKMPVHLDLVTFYKICRSLVMSNGLI